MSRPSAPTPPWRLVAEREVRTKVKDKPFLASTGAMLLIIVAVVVFTAVTGSRADRYDVTVGPGVDAGLVELAERVLTSTTSPGASIEADEADDAAGVDAAVTGGDADAGILLDGDYVLVGDDRIDPALQAALTAAVGEWVLQNNAEVDSVDLRALREGTAPELRLLDPNADEADARSGVAFMFVVVFLVTAMTFGMTIASSVVQEKESRVVEILAAAIPVRATLWGKIVGNTALAVAQIVLIAAVGVAGMLLTDQTDLLRGVGWSIAWYIGFFLLGFLTLASLWSVAGSIASRQEDLQSTTLPGQMVLLVPYFAALLGGDQVRTVLSMLPVVSTMVMPGRLAEGSVPWWQIAVAVVLTVLAAVVFVRLGARLYERTLLLTGTRLSYREALRLPGE